MIPLPKRAPGAAPALALGAMNFGKRTEPAEGERIVRRALERGIRLFDTANSYNAGQSERILGQALGRDRSKILLSTKAGLGLVPGRPEGLSPEVILKAIDGSLERLGTDAVDFFYLHLPDRTTPIERTLEAVQALLASGKIKHWALSNYAAWEVLEIDVLADRLGLPRPSVVQALYNVLHRELEVDYIPFARRYPVHTMAYNALAGGMLTGRHRFGERPEKGTRFDANPMYQRRYWTATMFERVAQLERVRETEGCTWIELAFSWLVSRSDVDSILLGPATVEQLDQACDACERPLSRTAALRIDELAREWAGTDTHYVR